MLLQSSTKDQLENAIKSNVHAVLITGPSGSGKGFVAKYFTTQKLGLSGVGKLEIHPYFSVIAPDNGSISIDQIRELQKFLQLKTIGKSDIRRAVIIEDAHLMTGEAQNALLKALEEPPLDTVITLTAPKSLKLKETIYSRVQQVNLLPISKSDAIDYFSKNHSKSEIEKAFLMSNGNMGLLYALLTSEDHQLASEISRTKTLLGQKTYERLINVDELSKQKENLPYFFQALKLICSAALEQSASKNDSKKTARWHKSLQKIYKAEASLQSNPNPKLLLTDLLLNL